MAQTTITYCLGSSRAVYAPGVVNWAIAGYRSEDDRDVLAGIGRRITILAFGPDEADAFAALIKGRRGARHVRVRIADPGTEGVNANRPGERG